jgi:hypothetical protein
LLAAAWLRLETRWPGANPTIASYNATGSLARFENKSFLFYFEKGSSLPTTTLAL